MAIRPAVEPAPSSFDPILFWSLHRTKIIYGSVAVALLLLILAIVMGYRAVQTQKAGAAFAAAEASGDWQSVISRYPGSTAAGNAYLRLDQDAPAVKAFQQAIKVRPNFAQARYNLGVAYFATGNRKGAQDEYNTLRRLDPARAAKLQAIIGGRR